MNMTVMSGLLKSTVLGDKMTNERVKEVLRGCSREQLTPVGNSFIHQRTVDYDEFAKQIIGQTVLVILTADTRDMVYTTHDKSVVDGITGRIVDAVRNYWELK